MRPAVSAAPAGHGHSDRRDDPRTIVGRVVKPPVLSRAALHALCVACLAVIAYGTLGPLGGDRGPWLVSVPNWHWLPPWRSGGFDDVLANFVVYVPVGIAFRLLVRRRGQAAWFDFGAALALSAVVSYLTEVAQQAMPARVSSLTDIIVNVAAAFIGCLCAVPVQRAIRHLHAFLFEQVRVPGGLWTVMAWAAAAITAVLMTMPWSLTWPAMRWGFDEPLGSLCIRRFMAFGVVAFLCTGAAIARGCTQRRAFAVACACASGLALLLEGAQVILHEHVCSAFHFCVELAGSGTGSLLAVVLIGRSLRPVPVPAPIPLGVRPVATDPEQRCTKTSNADPTHERVRRPPHLHRVAFVALVATMLHVVAGLWHFGWTLPPRTEPLIHWVPFRAEFLMPFPAMLADTLEQLVVYALVTLSCLSLGGGRGRGVALLLLLGLITLTEAGQAFLGVRGADTTAPLLAALAWVLTVRAWASLYPRATAIDDSRTVTRLSASAPGADA